MKPLRLLVVVLALMTSVATAHAVEPYRFRDAEIDALRAAAASNQQLEKSQVVLDGFYRILAAIGGGKTVRWSDRQSGRLQTFVDEFKGNLKGEMRGERIFVGSACSSGSHCSAWFLADVRTGHVVLVSRWLHDDAGRLLDRPSSVVGFFHMSCANRELLEAVEGFAKQTPANSYLKFDQIEHRTYVTRCGK